MHTHKHTLTTHWQIVSQVACHSVGTTIGMEEHSIVTKEQQNREIVPQSQFTGLAQSRPVPCNITRAGQTRAGQTEPDQDTLLPPLRDSSLSGKLTKRTIIQDTLPKTHNVKHIHLKYLN